MYPTRDTLLQAIECLRGGADHLLKIWFTLKQMGMRENTAVYVDTSSPTPYLTRLFGYGHPEGEFFIPFAHTKRFLTMKSDAARSIIQTNIKRWQASGSVVTVDPTNYLDIREMSDGSLEVKPNRNYPMGLGFGKQGFALDDNTRVAIPLISFAIWYYRQESIGGDFSRSAFVSRLREDLHLSAAEIELIFVDDNPTWMPTTQSQPLSDADIFEVVQRSLEAGDSNSRSISVVETFDQYVTKVKSMVTLSPGPAWLNSDPTLQLQRLVSAGSVAVLLYGPPRTGKTRAIDEIVPRSDPRRETIQIHDGWGYDELMIGLRPYPDGTWGYIPGAILSAIRSGKSYIVLEEINRTSFTQAIGELFSLLESMYRGQGNSIRLRDGSEFFVPEETVFFFTMNTLDRSTEEVDDALFGRVDAVEFPTRVEELQDLLQQNGVADDVAAKVRELFAAIIQYYPLGHGYFAAFTPETNAIDYYLARVRPVLQKHLMGYRDNELASIDEKVSLIFG